jgi:hypothetical protein
MWDCHAAWHWKQEHLSASWCAPDLTLEKHSISTFPRGWPRGALICTRAILVRPLSFGSPQKKNLLHVYESTYHHAPYQSRPILSSPAETVVAPSRDKRAICPAFTKDLTWRSHNRARLQHLHLLVIVLHKKFKQTKKKEHGGSGMAREDVGTVPHTMYSLRPLIPIFTMMYLDSKYVYIHHGRDRY